MSDDIKTLLRYFDKKPDRERNRDARERVNTAIKNYRRRFRVSKELNESSLDLIEDWQNQRTKTVKRFIFGLSLILTGAGILGAEISNLAIFGLQAGGSAAIGFAWFLGSIVFFSWIAFELSLHVDKKRRDKRLRDIEDKIPDAIEGYKEIKSNLEANDVKPKDFFNGLKSFDQYGAGEIQKQYSSISRYYLDISVSHSIDKILHKMDVWVIRVLVFIGITSLTPLWGITYTAPPV